MNSIVLLSGGLDSAVALAYANSLGLNTHAVSFDYGQKHKAELEAARKVVAIVGAQSHTVLYIDLTVFGNSALTADIQVPKNNMPVSSIPVTYVPARNTIFLSYALAMAEVKVASKIYIGVNQLDYSGYPDCRKEYLDAYQVMANLATKAGVEGTGRVSIEAPLLRMTKAEIILLGVSLGVDFSITKSCYDPDSSGNACGFCDACMLRAKGFAEAKVADPTTYTNKART